MSQPNENKLQSRFFIYFKINYQLVIIVQELVYIALF